MHRAINDFVLNLTHGGYLFYNLELATRIGIPTYLGNFYSYVRLLTL